MEKGRKQEAENGLGAAWAKCKSAKPATGAPVTASGCKQMFCRSIEAVPRKGAANQGGTTGASRFRPCGQNAQRTEAFFVAPGPHTAQMVLRGAKHTVYL